MNDKPAQTRRFMSIENRVGLGSLRDFAGFNAGRADLHSACAALRQLNTY